MGTGEAAELIGVDPRTIERWVDDEKIRGGRPRNPLTGEAVKGSHRWVDAEHAVLYAVGANRTHLIPPQWRRFIPDGMVPAQATGS